MSDSAHLADAPVIRVSLPDGSVKTTARGTRIIDFVRASIGAGLAKAAIAAKLDGQEVDLERPLLADTKLEVITSKSEGALELIRHSSAHVVASVVQKLFPGTQVTIGPVIEDGFFYDFFAARPFTPEDLERIEQGVNELLAADVKFSRSELPVAQAIEFFKAKGEAFKAEIIEDLAAKGAETVSLYQHGDWIDLCRGPHIPSTGKIGAIKLTATSGAYWRGDSSKPMLQRIYGTAWRSKEELAAYLARIEEAKKRDHRRLGKDLELFTFHPYAPGAAFWLPKGAVLYNILSQFMRQALLANGYQEVRTPLLFNKALWQISGHWDKYRENMFLVEEKQDEPAEFSLKPMNCPSHHLLFASTRRSYRELPLRFHDQGVLHRNEERGALGGLTRVRQFCQDDGHIYLAQSMIGEEVQRNIKLIAAVYGAFNLSFEAKFSTRPDKYIGTVETWDRAEADLKLALEGSGLPYALKPGDGAFYGPKIDFDVADSLGRKFQLATIQLDYQNPERFDLSYIGEDGGQHRPVIIHRAIFGSFERFIAILIEHYAGSFPVWLAPEQVRVLTVSEKQLEWAREVREALRARGLRVTLDESSEKLGAKIRLAQLAKVPYSLVVGDKEVEAKAVSPRRHGTEDLKQMPLAQFAELIEGEARWPTIGT